jgi:hypothetical protein
MPHRRKGHIGKYQDKEKFYGIQSFTGHGKERDREKEKVLERLELMKIRRKEFVDMVHKKSVGNQVKGKQKNMISIGVYESGKKTEDNYE